MDSDLVISLAVAAMELALKVALPLLLVGLAVGLIISVFQAVTQIQEMTLAFVPKIIAVFLVLLALSGWIMQKMVAYTTGIFTNIPNYIR